MGEVSWRDYFSIRDPRFRYALIVFVLIAAVGIWAGTDSDTVHYRMMAMGQFDEVASPFRTRILHPWLISLVGSVVGIDAGAWVVQAVLGIGFLIGLAQLYKQLGLGREWFWLTAALGGFVAGATEPFMPEMISAMLLVWALVFFERRWDWLVLGTLFVMGVARESVLLFALVLTVAAVKDRRWVLGAGSLVASLGGTVLATKLVGQGQSLHGFGGPLYLVLKMPFNLSKNLIGLSFWTNTFGDIVDHAPWVKWESPVKLGSITQVGIYDWTFAHPAIYFGQAVLLFGFATWFMWRERGAIREQVKSEPNRVVWVCFWYGAISFLLAPALGSSVGRLISYAWPLMTVVFAWWADRNWEKDQTKAFYAWHFGLAGAVGASLGLIKLWPRVAICLGALAALILFREKWMAAIKWKS